jgi:hypothetical protein
VTIDEAREWLKSNLTPSHYDCEVTFCGELDQLVADMHNSATRDGDELREQLAEARRLLEKAREYIHGEYCSQKHYPICDEIARFLEVK